MKIILKLIREFYAIGANLEAFVKSLIKYQQPENSLSEGSDVWQTRLEGNIFLANLHEGV